MKIDQHQSSFKDPHGSIVSVNGEILRVVKTNYRNEFEHLTNSGLLAELLERGLIVTHTEITDRTSLGEFGSDVFKVIKPEKVQITYASEWSFNQLKDAALCTLQIQMIALRFGMILKDASAYNIQFRSGRPVLIDTLSFEFYRVGEPWVAYRQFCEHFYGPLLLLAYVDPSLTALYTSHIDGIPIQLVNKLLPWKRKWNFGVLFHVVLHARAARTHSTATVTQTQKAFTPDYIKHLAENLQRQTEQIQWRQKTSWAGYYEQNVSQAYLESKVQLVREIVTKAGLKRLLDIGANDGTISRDMARHTAFVIAADFDHESVDRNYRLIKEEKIENVLPLVINCINPTPGFGWANTERQSFTDRLSVDAVVALALIHHLVIFYNIPFEKVAGYFSQLAERLIIEFVPSTDPMARILLQRKADVYGHYTEENFRETFSRFYQLRESIQISNSERVLYYFEK